MVVLGQWVCLLHMQLTWNLGFFHLVNVPSIIFCIQLLQGELEEALLLLEKSSLEVPQLVLSTGLSPEPTFKAREFGGQSNYVLKRKGKEFTDCQTVTPSYQGHSFWYLLEWNLCFLDPVFSYFFYFLGLVEHTLKQLLRKGENEINSFQ